MNGRKLIFTMSGQPIIFGQGKKPIKGKFMMKKYLTFAFICMLLVTANSPFILAQTQADKTTTSAKVKTKVADRGTGENKRVEVKMLNGTKLKGYISQSGADSFTLVDANTKQ